MELQREKPLRFLQNDRPQQAAASRRRREGRGRGRTPGFGALSNPGELGCGAAQNKSGVVPLSRLPGVQVTGTQLKNHHPPKL